MKYIESNITFNDIKQSVVSIGGIATESPYTINGTAAGPTYYKEGHTNFNTVLSESGHAQVLNAIDIHWGSANLGTINGNDYSNVVTTGQVLSAIIDAAKYVESNSGAQGAKGAQGSRGAQGAKGTNGTQGIRGAQGARGPQGAKGTNGTQGIRGAQGTQGTIINNSSIGIVLSNNSSISSQLTTSNSIYNTTSKMTL